MPAHRCALRQPFDELRAGDTLTTDRPGGAGSGEAQKTLYILTRTSRNQKNKRKERKSLNRTGDKHPNPDEPEPKG